MVRDASRPRPRPGLCFLRGREANIRNWRTGVKSHDVSLESQTATIVAEPSLSYEKVLQTIAKTGKKVNTGEADGIIQSVEVPAAA